MNIFAARGGKPVQIKVTTMEADLNGISIEPEWTGRQLFDTICRIVGLREIWYFGLQYSNKKGIASWLQMEKKIISQEVPRANDGSMHFLFVVKFFPESVDDELIQDITRHLFFLQVKQSILNMDLYCPPEASILLASYAAQAAYGDCSDDIELELDKLLPQSVIEQYDMSSEMWESRIRKWWENNGGLITEDAEAEYLRVAQDLDMWGIFFYPIYNQKDTNLLLGVSAQGIGIYETSNRLSPRPFFPWSEIHNISFRNKLFTICVADKSKIKFRAQEASINISILDLCIGTHNLYLRRRQSDTLEVQQMKMQAKEKREKRLADQAAFIKERERRVQAEKERDRYKDEITALTEQIAHLEQAMKNTEDNHKVYLEKAKVSEQEALELVKRASHAEAEVQRAKMSQIQAEETKMALERKVRDTELMAQRLLQDPDRRNRENMFRSQMIVNNNNSNGEAWDPYSRYQTNLVHPLRHSEAGIQIVANDASHPQFRPNNGMDEDHANDLNGHMGEESLADASDGISNEIVTMTNQLMKATKTVSTQNLSYSTTNAKSYNPAYKSQITLNTSDTPPPSTAGGQSASNYSNSLFSAEIEELRAEIEKSRAEYYEKNRDLKERLMEFRAEIEGMKKEDRETDHDRVHAANLQFGIDKYSSLRKSGAGSSKSRVQVFDGL